MQHIAQPLLALSLVAPMLAIAADSTSVTGRSSAVLSACPNLPGYTSSTPPSGMTRDSIGNCVPAATASTEVDAADFKYVDACVQVAEAQTNTWDTCARIGCWGSMEVSRVFYTTADPAFTASGAGSCTPNNGYAPVGSKISSGGPLTQHFINFSGPLTVKGQYYWSTLSKPTPEIKKMAIPPVSKAKTVSCAIPRTSGSLPSDVWFVSPGNSPSGPFLKTKNVTGSRSDRYSFNAAQEVTNPPLLSPAIVATSLGVRESLPTVPMLTSGSSIAVGTHLAVNQGTFTGADIFPAGTFAVHNDVMNKPLAITQDDYSPPGTNWMSAVPDGDKVYYSPWAIQYGCSVTTGPSAGKSGYLMYDKMIMVSDFYIE